MTSSGVGSDVDFTIAVLAGALDGLQMEAGNVLRAGTSEIAGRLSQRIRDDLATEPTIRLDGWLLSLAEARFTLLPRW
jgi:hypothetical protein